MSFRKLSWPDRILVEVGHALASACNPEPAATRASPAAGIAEADLDPSERRHAAGLMRVNHVGEVCAQALYFGQAAVARGDGVRERLLGAAAEETDHLARCGARLREPD